MHHFLSVIESLPIMQMFFLILIDSLCQLDGIVKCGFPDKKKKKKKKNK